MFKVSSKETILFDHHSKMYLFTKKTNAWDEYAVGNMKIRANVDNLNAVELLLHSEKGSMISYNEVIDGNIFIDESQISQCILMWTRRDCVEGKQWAIEFDDVKTCEKFCNIVLVVTAAPEKMTATYQPDFMQQLNLFSMTESPEEFKQRFMKTYKATRIQSYLRNIQTWHEINASLGIASESQRQFYQSVCENLIQTSISLSTKESSNNKP